MGGSKGVLRGCSEAFKAFVMMVVPGVVLEQRRFMDLDNSSRNIDFVEVFSGKANLSSQMREVSWLMIGIFLATSFFCLCAGVLNKR